MKKKVIYILFTLIIFNPSLYAATKMNPVVSAFIEDLAAQEKKTDPKFTWFSAEKGEELYRLERIHSKKGKKRSCVTCHKENPRSASRHAVSGKPLKALAPSVNRKRFTKKSKIKKWFRRNCKWVFERECTNREKGDFLTWIYTI